MDLKHYFSLLIRWAWLLAIGAIIGAAAGYIYSKNQPEVYQSSTKILIMRSSNAQQSSDVSYLSDQQLVNTLSELLITKPNLEETSKRLNTSVSARQVKIQQIGSSQMIQVTVTDGDPQRAADIANTLVKVFLEQNEAIQNSRYSSTEDSLQTQIKQVQDQIDSLQKQLSTESTQSLDTQIQEVTKTITSLKTEMQTLQQEMITIQYGGELVSYYDDRGRLVKGLPTLTVQQRVDLADRQDRYDELQNLLTTYQKIYFDLTYSSGTSSSQGTRNEQIQAALTLYQQIYASYLANYESVRLAHLNNTPTIVQAETAVPKKTPIQPRPLMNMGLGAVAGLLLAGVISFIMDYLDDTLRSSEDVLSLLQLPIVGFIGEMPPVRNMRGKENIPYVLQKPRSPIAEAFRTLRTNIDFYNIDSPPKTLLIASPGVSEGKTTIAVNLGTVIAQAGRKVVLVDADLRRPRVHQALGLSNRVGLSDLLRSNASIQAVTQNFNHGKITVITSGSLPPNPAEVLGSEKMNQILHELEQLFDVVILDGPPFLLADASVLASRVNGVLMVVQINQTQAKASLAMMDQLTRSNAKIIGVVLNRIRSRDAHYYYKGLKGYSYFSYDVEERTPVEKAAE